jgi:hypothetical protein
LPLILADVPRGLKLALRQEGVPFRQARRGLPEGRFVLFDGRNKSRPAVAAGQTAVDIDPLRTGFDRDPFEALVDETSQRLAWRIGPFLASEEIAAVDKRSVRRRILGTLRSRLEEIGGIWLRVSPYPFPYQSAFNFRIDYDEYDRESFSATQAAISGHEHATSHFVCGASYRSAGESLIRIRDLDVGSHGYRHHTYRTVEENLDNVRRGIEVLCRAGIEPSGFAAPHGRFNAALVEALETLNVGHSSEFGLVWDELPLDIGRGDLLQIPVHPVSLGIVIDAARDIAGDDREEAEARAAQAALDHFRDFALSQHHRGEPVFLYGHPTRRLGRYPHVLTNVFETVDHLRSMWKTTRSEFASWWRIRCAVRLTVTRQGNRFTVAAQQRVPGYRIGIEYFRGEHVSLLPLDGRVRDFSPGSIGYQKRETDSAFCPVRVDGPEPFRQRVRRMLDWERVTPVDEIKPNNLRNLAKRTLRRLWSR